MKLGGPRHFRRAILLAAACTLAVVLTACTGRGGGQLPPSSGFSAPASFGFSFSCQDSGGLNPPTGQLKIELSYTDKGINPIGSSFGIHGIVDKVDPVLESAICIGKNPPPGGNELIFLGRYYLTSSAPSGFPSTCPTRETKTSSLCRFEVKVEDNDKNDAPSPGDHFQITLSTGTSGTCTDPTDFSCSNLSGTLFYIRAGNLSRGNITVD
jgi:hypothetical protein